MKQDRFAQIARLGETIFHTKDLASLWQIQSANTLHTTLKRYTAKGLLYRVYRGLYALKPLDQLDPILLGLKALHSFAYISTETVLAKAGIIFQVSDTITLVSAKSRNFSIGDYYYDSRRLSVKFLYQPAGIIEQNGIKMATVERAVADLLYFNPKAYFDAPKFINWQKVKQIQKIIGYPLTPQRYDFTKSQRCKT